MTHSAFNQFKQQLEQDSNIRYPAINIEYLEKLLHALEADTDDDVYKATRNESFYREAIASVHNIIYWYYWLGLHESVAEQAEHFWQCLMASLALRGIYIDNLITEMHKNKEKQMATDPDFDADFFYLASVDVCTQQLMQAAAYLFKLDIGFAKVVNDPSLRLHTLANEAANASSNHDMMEVCKKLGLRKSGLLKLNDVGLWRQTDGQKAPGKPASIKVF
jgi:hypothetical protein